MFWKNLSVLVFVLGLVCAGSGCSCRPAPPKAPDLNPAAMGAAALAEYDANADGVLDAKELEKCPPLKLALKRFDANGDGKISADEIAARVRSWMNSGTTIVTGGTHVTLDGKALAGATVTFEPEKFLGPAFKTCTGKTDEFGNASVSGQDAQFPGLYLGLYRVKISKVVDGKETLPAKYNTATVLAHEAATDIAGVGAIDFKLKSQ